MKDLNVTQGAHVCLVWHSFEDGEEGELSQENQIELRLERGWRASSANDMNHRRKREERRERTSLSSHTIFRTQSGLAAIQKGIRVHSHGKNYRQNRQP